MLLSGVSLRGHGLTWDSRSVGCHECSTAGHSCTVMHAMVNGAVRTAHVVHASWSSCQYSSRAALVPSAAALVGLVVGHYSAVLVSFSTFGLVLVLAVFRHFRLKLLHLALVVPTGKNYKKLLKLKTN